MRYCQVVIGPAGAGKSTYCQLMQKHCDTIGRNVHIANLDPAAEHFSYEPAFDIRDLCTVDEAMSSLQLGPNGALVYCMEHLSENLDWLEEELGGFEDDYLLLDCPGQIELYSHIPVMHNVTRALERHGYRLCTVYLSDAQFMGDPAKFISGAMTCLSAMVRLELPHVSVLTKCDLLGSTVGLSRFTHPEAADIARDLDEGTPRSYRALNGAIASLIDEYAMVSFTPLDRRDEEAVSAVLAQVDNAMGYGEDEEVKIAEDEAFDDKDAPLDFASVGL